MAGTVVADTLQAASTSTLVIKNGVANTPPTIQDSAGTQIGTFCRAWVNFDGTGTFSPNPSTTKIRASFNVSSITDNGTGDYTVNFTNAMPDANYAVVGGGYTTASGNSRGLGSFTSTAVGSFRYVHVYVSSTGGAGVAIDESLMQFSVFR